MRLWKSGRLEKVLVDDLLGKNGDIYDRDFLGFIWACFTWNSLKSISQKLINKVVKFWIFLFPVDPTLWLSFRFGTNFEVFLDHYQNVLPLKPAFILSIKTFFQALTQQRKIHLVVIHYQSVQFSRIDPNHCNSVSKIFYQRLN